MEHADDEVEMAGEKACFFVSFVSDYAVYELGEMV